MAALSLDAEHGIRHEDVGTDEIFHGIEHPLDPAPVIAHARGMID